MQLEEKSTAGVSPIGDNLDRRVAIFLRLLLLYFVAVAEVAATETVVAEAVAPAVICCCCCFDLLLLLQVATAAATSVLNGGHSGYIGRKNLSEMGIYRGYFQKSDVKIRL